MGYIQAAEGLAGGDEAGSDGGVRVAVEEDELGLDLRDVRSGGAVG